MSALRLSCACSSFARRFSTVPEYTEKPEYPPILDLSRDAVIRRKNEAWHDKIKGLKSVEEKLIEVNMPRYYGWRCIGLFEGRVPYGSLPFAQYITRTHICSETQLPEFYQNTGLADICRPILERVKNPIKEAIALEYAVQRNQDEEENENIFDVGEAIIHQINRVIISYLSTDFPHLLSCQVDHFPRLESFWIVGGMNPTKQLEKKREKMIKDDLGKPVDVKFQYLGRPIAQLRHKYPLLPVADLSEAVNIDKIPVFQYDPKVLTLNKLQRHVTNIPGFWPGDAAGFPLMSFHSSEYLADRSQSFDDKSEAPFVHTILSSFAWLQALASFQGFSTFQDVTYPMVTQTVLSNGQYWSFYVYQLNTTLLHSNYSTENPKCNMCWGTNKLKLFDKFEDGKIVGFNEDVLKILLLFYLNVPQELSGIQTNPYLGAENKYIANIEDKERRIWLENTFKHMYSNRPRNRLPYEIYNWEKIYKIDHNTRQFEARHRPFEKGEKPHLKRYDDHTPPYIPKAVRNGKKPKFEKTYYP